MSSPAKWIKLSVDLFDDEKFKILNDIADRDQLIVIWIQLLCLAGKKNNGGRFTIGNIHYSIGTFASVFGRSEEQIEKVFSLFIELNMIAIDEDGVYSIPHWNEYQSLEALEKKRERDRLYQSKKRQESLTSEKEIVDESLTSRKRVADIDKIRLDKNRLDKNTEEKIDYKSIMSQFNEICISLPNMTQITQTRRTALKRMIAEGINLESYFQRVESSDYLTGRSTSGWKATIDWIIKPQNVLKIQEGNYDNQNKSKAHFSGQSSFDADEFLKNAMARR